VHWFDSRGGPLSPGTDADESYGRDHGQADGGGQDRRHPAGPERHSDDDASQSVRGCIYPIAYAHLTLKGSCVVAEREPFGARRSPAARKCGGASRPRRSVGNSSLSRATQLALIVRCRAENLDRRASDRVPSRRRIFRRAEPALDLRQRNCLSD